MITKIKNLGKDTIWAIKNFKSNPIENLGFIMPTVMCIISILTAIVSYIIFIVQGGYTTQIANIKASGFDGISNSFTDGTSDLLMSEPITKILGMLFVAELIVLFILYFRAEEKRKNYDDSGFIGNGKSYIGFYSASVCLY